MSRLVDPAICPDCRARVDPSARCQACGLVLSGPLGAALWGHMIAADGVIEEIRRQQAPRPAVEPASQLVRQPLGPPAAPPPAPYPAPAPRPAGPTAATGLSGKTVPALLLGLGGLFVLVAVSLFLAVTWTVLPLAVKAVLMVGFTAGMGTGAAALARRGLRGSAEALWAVTAALLALDLSAAWRSGLFGLDALSGRTMAAVTGLLLMVLGAAVVAGVRRTPLPRLVAAEAALAAGLLTLAISEVFTGPGSDGTRLVVGSLVLAALAVALRHRSRELAGLSLVLAAVAWVALVSAGADRALAATDRGDYWTGLVAWRLLVAACLIALPTLTGRVRGDVRTACAGAALACIGLAVVSPPEATTLGVLLLAAVLLALALLALLPRGAWSMAAAGLAAIGVAGTAGLVVLTPVATTLDFVVDHRPWATAPGARFADLGGPDAWTLLVLVAVAVLAAAAAARHLPAPAANGVRTTLVTALPTAAVLTGSAVLAGSRAPFAVVTSGLVLTALLGLRRTTTTSDWRSAPLVAVLVGAEAGVLSLALATRSDLLTALVASVLSAAALVEHLRRTDRLSPEYGVAAVLLVAWAAYGWARVGDLDPTLRIVVPLLVSATCLLVSGVLRRPGYWLLEAAAGVGLVAEVLAASGDPDRLALALTLAGSALALTSVLRIDRIEVGWLAGVVLFAATLVRLTTDQRLAPELYALPAATLLLVVGCYRLVRSPRRGSWRTLGSGLNLALVPSLLITLPDPSSLRGLLVGVGAAAALAAGLRLRWQAPYLTGTAVLGVLALRFLLPLAADVLANPLGAWMLFGTAGGLLLTAGILWEQSLRRLRSASQFVGALV